MRILLLLLVLCSIIRPAASQVLTGSIQDAETGDPLAGAGIFVPLLQAGTVTGGDGNYTLNLASAGTYRVVYSYLGYRSETHVLNIPADTVRLDLRLQPSVIEAPPVTVTATGEARDILSTPEAVVVLSAEDLLHEQGVAALDVLENVPGIRLQRTGTTVAKPVVRGLSAQRVVVVNDGVRQESQQWGDEHGPEFDPYEQDRVEVVKGPASLIYGSDALGGVVEVAREDLFSFRKPVYGSVLLQTMSNARLGGAHLELGGKRGALAYNAGFSARSAGSYDTPAGLVPNTGLDEMSGSLRFGRQTGRSSIEADVEHYEARLGMFEPEMTVAADRNAITFPYQRIAHDRIHVRGVTRSNGHRIELLGSLQQNRRKEFAEAPAEGPLEPELFLRLTTGILETRLHHRPVGRLFGTVGASAMLQQNETLAEEALIPGARVMNGALYLAEELLLDRVTLKGGLRLDARSLDAEPAPGTDFDPAARTYYAVTGAFGSAWQPVRTVSFGLNLGRAWRAPVLIELFSQGVHEGTARYEVGHPDLRPEKSLSLDATARWMTSHISFEGNAFVNQVDGFIYPRDTGLMDDESGYRIYRYEQAPARLWGMEFAADLHPHPLDWMHLRFSGDAMWSRNEDTASPLPLTPSPRLTVRAQLHAGRIGRFYDSQVNFGPTLVARQKRVSEFEVAAESYTLWDASVSTMLRAGVVNIVPVLAVDNIFDTSYTATLSRFKPYGILDPGRNVRFSIRVETSR